jgi:archaemetzincin
MSELCLVPIFTSGRDPLIEELVHRLTRTFPLQVRIREPWFDPQLTYDASRGQYNSNMLLGQLLSDPSEQTLRILGVTSVDLFIPVLTYVFGEAQLGGRAAVVSTNRLRSEKYGLPPDSETLISRLEKEAVHELGHTFELLHCLDSACVMSPSTYVEEIDPKGAGFCAACLETLREKRPLGGPELVSNEG